MIPSFRCIIALALVSAAGGALAAAPPPTGGTIAINARSSDRDDDNSLPSFIAAAATALTARGFTVLDDPNHAAATVELVLSRADVGTGLARTPGERKASVAGAGVFVPLSTGASQLVHLQRTRLELRLRRRSAPLSWDGIAVTVREASTRKGADGIVATDLISALLQSYPAQPTEILGVP